MLINTFWLINIVFFNGEEEWHKLNLWRGRVSYSNPDFCLGCSSCGVGVEFGQTRLFAIPRNQVTNLGTQEEY